MSCGVSMTMKPSDADRRVIRPVRKGTDTGVPLTCQRQRTTLVCCNAELVWVCRTDETYHSGAPDVWVFFWEGLV